MTTTGQEEEAITVADAARILGVLPTRVSAMKRDGVLPTVGPNVPGAPVALSAVLDRAFSPPRRGGPRPLPERGPDALTVRQRHVLAEIRQAPGPVTAPDLARLTGQERGNVLHTLYRMEQLDLVHQAGHDRTTRGWPILWEPLPARDDDAEFLAALTNEEENTDHE